MAYVGLACQWTIATVYCLAVLAKVRGRTQAAGFVSSLAAMGLVGRSAAGRLATTIVVLETIVVVLLAVPMTVSAGFALAGLTNLAFAVGIRRAVRHGARVPCRCFGASSAPLGPAHVLRNVLLIAVACVGLLAQALASAGPADLAGVIVALFAALVLVLLVRFLDEIHDAFSHASIATR